MSNLHGIGEHVDDPTEPSEEPATELPSFEELVEEYGPVDEPKEEEIEESQEEEIDPITLLVFNEKHGDDFDGLLHLGELRYEFVWANHTFLIRTLKVDELLQVSLLTKDFAGSYGADRAYVTALVAAALMEVDGQPIYQSLGKHDEIERVAKKYSYIRKNWYAHTIDAVYSEVQKLEARATQLVEAMGEPSS